MSNISRNEYMNNQRSGRRTEGSLRPRLTRHDATSAKTPSSCSEINSGPNTETCAICFDPMKLDIKLPCRHSFGGACIKGWLETGGKTCPLCRTALSEEDIDAVYREVEKAQWPSGS